MSTDITTNEKAKILRRLVNQSATDRGTSTRYTVRKGRGTAGAWIDIRIAPRFTDNGRASEAQCQELAEILGVARTTGVHSIDPRGTEFERLFCHLQGMRSYVPTDDEGWAAEARTWD